MKICAYVQRQYAKSAYKNECMDTRQFVGLRVVMDAVTRAGYTVEWAGIDTVHEYDIVLVSITSDCDWWPFIKERLQWRKGAYKVIVGGAGVLHVAPFLAFADYFSLGRGEVSVPNLVRKIDGKPALDDNSIICSSDFSPNKVYQIRQELPYPFPVDIANGVFEEKTIGCNHKCLFCGYTWQRKFCSPYSTYRMDDGIFGQLGSIANKERAMLDMMNGDPIDFSVLRTTAIDGMSQRLRYMVGKRISHDMLVEFLRRCVASDAKPHQIKLYNIVGYPTETHEDWHEYLEALIAADGGHNDKQWSFLLHCTPFRPMPATPLACAPASLRNYRGEIGKILGKGLKGNLIYQGESLWSVEGMGCDSLATVMLSMIAHRASAVDTENIIRLCRTPKFWTASSAIKEATISKYFDVEYLFGSFTPTTLPSRYLRSYAAIEKTWSRQFWSEVPVYG